MIGTTARRLAVTAVGFAMLGAACDTMSGPQGPGDVVVALRSPSGSEGAAILEITGPGILAAAMPDGELFFEPGDPITAIVIRTTPGVIAFTMAVSDRGANFGGTIVQVAGPDNALRDLEGYDLEFTPVATER